MKTRRLEDGSMLYETAQARMRIVRLKPAFSLHICDGFVPAEFAPAVIADAQASLDAAGRCVVLVDSFDMKGNESDFRDGVGRWVRENRRRNIAAWVLQRSRLVEMAMGVINLVAGGEFIKVYSSVASWEANARRELVDFRRQPLDRVGAVQPSTPL